MAVPTQHATFTPGPEGVEQSTQELVAGQPIFVDITTPSANDTELEIVHDLRRVPKGAVVVKSPHTSFYYGHDPLTDTAWSASRIYLKFNGATGEKMTVAIF